MDRIITMPSKDHKAGREWENLPSTVRVLAVQADVEVNSLTEYEYNMELVELMNKQKSLQAYRLVLTQITQLLDPQVDPRVPH